jgi:hypothetical protein
MKKVLEKLCRLQHHLCVCSLLPILRVYLLLKRSSLVTERWPSLWRALTSGIKADFDQGSCNVDATRKA